MKNQVKNQNSKIKTQNKTKTKTNPEWVEGRKSKLRQDRGFAHVCEVAGACHWGGERSTDQHFPQAWAQACETPGVLRNLSWDLLRTNAVMC